MNYDIEIPIDGNLLHLNNILFDLDCYHFDDEIISKLNELKFLVDNKLYFILNNEEKDIIDYQLVCKYKLK